MKVTSSKRPNNDGIGSGSGDAPIGGDSSNRVVTTKEIDEAIARIMEERKDILKELSYV